MDAALAAALAGQAAAQAAHAAVAPELPTLVTPHEGVVQPHGHDAYSIHEGTRCPVELPHPGDGAPSGGVGVSGLDGG